MTLEEFIAKYNGTSVGSGQCVALIKQYQLDVLGTSAPSVGNAKEYWENYSTTPFLQATYDQIPLSSGCQIGDVAVWNGNVGHGYGHIDIVTGDISSSGFTGFDQNWNVALHCSIEAHSYSDVYGFLRPKSSPTPPTPGEDTPVGDIYHRNFNDNWFYSTLSGYTASITSSTQKEENAKYIWNYLESNGWTLASSSVFIACSEIVSTLNSAWRPTTDENSQFGLLGWRFWEFQDWVDDGGEYVASSDYTIIDNSIGRICWYKAYNLAWNNSSMTLLEFTLSESSATNLATIWYNSYAYIGDTIQVDLTRLQSRSKYWYDFLSKQTKKNFWKYKHYKFRSY